jgi:hypothetical protein
MRSILIILLFMLTFTAAKSQKWQSGYFYDVKGNKVTGLIRQNPPGKNPIKDEAFIEFKEDPKANLIKLSASDLRAYIVGRDSFVVAVSPKEGWSEYELDFVDVVLNTPLRLYAAMDGGGSGISFGPELGIGIGAGSYGGGFGGGFGGGISIPLGGHKNSKAIFFFGTNTAQMKPINNDNFVDVMSEVMGDEPEAVERIKDNKYNLRNIDKLIAYFEELEAAHK